MNNNNCSDNGVQEVYIIRDDLCDAETFTKKLWRGLAYGIGFGAGLMTIFGIFVIIGVIIAI